MSKKIVVPSDITITTEDAAATITLLNRAANLLKSTSPASRTDLVYSLEAQANTLQDYIDIATEAAEPDPDENRGEVPRVQIPLPSAGSLEVEGLNGMPMSIEEEEL